MSPARLQGLSGQSELEAVPARQLDGAVVKDRGRRFLFNVKASRLTTERAVRRPQAPHHQKYVTILSPTLLPGTGDVTTLCESPFPGPTPARAVPRLSLPPQARQPLHATPQSRHRSPDTAVPTPQSRHRSPESGVRVKSVRGEGAGQTRRWRVGESGAPRLGDRHLHLSPAERRAHGKSMATRGSPWPCLCPQRGPGFWGTELHWPTSPHKASQS